MIPVPFSPSESERKPRRHLRRVPECRAIDVSADRAGAEKLRVTKGVEHRGRERREKPGRPLLSLA